MTETRQGTDPHQHVIILHQIAEIARTNDDPATLNKRQLMARVDYLHSWIVSNAVRLLDDSRALHTIRSRPPTGEPG